MVCGFVRGDEMSKLINGECVDVLKTITDNSIDCVIIDPPYFLPATHYQTRKKQIRNFADLGILEFFFKNVFEEIKRAHEALEDTVLNILLAIRQNEYLQAWYPAQQGHPAQKVVGSHPIKIKERQRNGTNSQS